MRVMLAAVAALVSTAALADSTVNYTVLILDRPSGSQVTVFHDDGRVDTDMSYRDNGRGPDIKERTRFSPDGTLLSLDTTGKSTFGAPIEEHFVLKGQTAQWRSLADKGTKTLSGPAVYVPNDNSFEAFGFIARAALRQPQGKIAALPAGEMAITRVLDHQVQSGARSVQLSLYAITGLTTQPAFAWLTHDERPQFFAF